MKALKNNWYRHAREKLFFAAFVVSVSIQLPAQPGIYFDIPGQNLSEALVLFAEQADVNVIVPAEMLSGQVSSPLVGPFTVEDALSALLSKSTFGFDVVDGGRSVVLFVSNRSDLVGEGDSGAMLVGGPRLESMIVSARHRDELVHDVPMSISVFGGERLEKQGTTNLPQLSYFAGNTVFKVTRGTNSAMSAYIRGLGQDDPLAGYQTGVGVYVDGVYISRPQTPVMDIYDAERIEILRGPQGTLYGRNTIGGAIKYVTKGFTDTASGYLSLALGSYDQQDLTLHGQSPIEGTTVKLGATLASFRRDGYGKNFETGASNYDKDILGFRSKMEFAPNDAVDVIFSFDLTNDNSSIKSGYRRITYENRPLLAGKYDTEAGITQSRHPFSDNEVRARGYSMHIEWDMSPQWQLTSITATREDDVKTAIDFISLPEPNFDTHILYDNEQRSQELRFAYEGRGVHVLFGAYYLDAKALSAFEVEVEVDPTYDASTFSLADVDSTSASIFASLTMDLNRSLKATAGGRYTEDRHAARIYRDTFVAPPSDGSNVPFFGGDGFSVESVVRDGAGNEVHPNFRGKRTDYGFTPQVSVSWHPDESAHLYASYSQGYKSGSFDPRGDYREPTERTGFGPETVDAYEIGLKSVFWQNQLKTNLAIFQNDYRDVQTSIAGSQAIQGTNAAVTNGAEATITGGELDLRLDLFQSSQFYFLNVSYLDAKYKRYIDASGSNKQSEYIFPNAPEFTVSAGAYYEREMLSTGKGFFTFYGNYRKDLAVIHLPENIEPYSYGTLNAALGWSSPNEQWLLSVASLNLLDERYIVDAYDFTQFDFITVFYGDPRTVTVSLKYSF